MQSKDSSSLGSYLKLMLKDNFQGQVHLQEECPLSDEKMDELYKEAYDLYNDHKAVESATAFGLLIAMNPYSQVFWMGLGASRHLNKEFEKALQAYALASLLDDKDPGPHYHAAQAYLALKNEKEATKALNLAEALIHENPMHAPFRERVLKLKECFKSKECHDF